MALSLHFAESALARRLSETSGCHLDFMISSSMSVPLTWSRPLIVRIEETLMAGFGHGPAHPVEQEDPRIASRNARQGMRLFLIYLMFYAGFVGLNAFAPKQMETTPLFGVNLAILYGCGLIVAAMVLALIYCWQCRSDQTLPIEKS